MKLVPICEPCEKLLKPDGGIAPCGVAGLRKAHLGEQAPAEQSEIFTRAFKNCLFASSSEEIQINALYCL